MKGNLRFWYGFGRIHLINIKKKEHKKQVQFIPKIDFKNRRNNRQ